MFPLSQMSARPTQASPGAPTPPEVGRRGEGKTLMTEFTIHCKEPTFHEEPVQERLARLDRILAIIRRELPNILLTPVPFTPYNEVETIDAGEGTNGTGSRILRQTID
jgi:hypothetical protein